MQLTIELFRARFPEFSDTPDAMVQIAISDAKPYVSEDAYGDLYLQAWSYLAAAFLYGSTQTSGDTGDGFGAGANALPTIEQAAGKVSFKTASPSSSSGSDFDNWLTQTIYGQRFMAARSAVAVGVMIASGGFTGDCFQSTFNAKD